MFYVVYSNTHNKKKQQAFNQLEVSFYRVYVLERANMMILFNTAGKQAFSLCSE